MIFLQNSSRKTTDKQELSKYKINWLFDTISNALLPLVSVIRMIPLFLAFNTVFFCLPILSAVK